MQKSLSSLRLAVVALVAVAALAGTVWAAHESPSRTAAQAKLEAVKKSQHQQVAKAPIQKAQQALQRAADATAAGDEHHAAMLDALGLQWAETATSLVQAADLERKAAEMQRKLAAAETKSIRAKALLEETVARRGRARKKLEELQERGEAAAAKGETGGKR